MGRIRNKKMPRREFFGGGMAKKRSGLRGLGGQYTAAELKRKRTLSTGQCDSLKVDTGTMRVWISRCTVADGEPYNNKVSVEKLRNGRWETVETYKG